MMRFWRRRRGPDPLVCREFVELVTAYLEGTLPEAERARMDAHLAECDGCTGYLEDMRRLLPSFDPHVIVCELTLPDGSGDNACRRLKVAGNKLRPVVLMSPFIVTVK